MPYPANIRDINAWFDTDEHIFLENLLAAFSYPWTFMIAQPKPMSGAVKQIVPIPFFL